MSKKKKLLFVSATLEAGGVQSILSNLTLQLQDKYDITILLNDTEKIMYPYGGNIVSLGMKQRDNRSNLWYQIAVLVKRYLKLCSLKKTKEYEACISMLDSANVANILSGNKHCKVVTTAYTNLTAEKYDWAYRYFVIPATKCLYNHSDILVVTSEGVKRDLAQNYGLREEKMTVVYDGVDIRSITNLKQEKIDKTEFNIEGKTVITTLGRLNPAKGQWHLIRAMKKVQKQCPDVKLLIMGTGTLKEKLESLIQECGVEACVKVCGYVKNPFKYIANSEAFVLSSIVEGYPTVLLEAMVCGTPCICTDFESGGREILAPDTDVDIRQLEEVEKAKYGIITPVCDGVIRNGEAELTKEEELLADGIIEMVENKELQNHYREVIKAYSDSFSIERCTEAWECVLEQL